MNEEIQEIDTLQKRYHDLNVKKIKAANNLEHAKRALELHQTEALNKYGTSDVEVLREKLNQMITQNDVKKKAYQESLDKIEQEIQEVETKNTTD